MLGVTEPLSVSPNPGEEDIGRAVAGRGSPAWKVNPVIEHLSTGGGKHEEHQSKAPRPSGAEASFERRARARRSSWSAYRVRVSETASTQG